MWISSFPSTIYWRGCLLSIEYFWLPCQILVDCICLGLFLGSNLCYIDFCVCFLPYSFDEYIFIIVKISCLKSGNMMPPTLLFLKIVLATWSLLWFCIYFSIVFSISVRNTIGINLIITCLSIVLFGFNLFVALWASWIWISISLPRFGEFSAIIVLNILSVPFLLPELP